MSKHASPSLKQWHKSLLTMLLTSTLAFLLMPLAERWELANIVMLFLLFVLMVAIKLGQTSGVVAAICSVFLFDFLFVPPRFSLEVANPEHLVTFVVMLITAVVSAQMAARLKKNAEDAQTREARTHSLYEVARALAGTQAVDAAAAITEEFLLAQVGLKAYVIVTDAQVVKDQMVGAAQFHVETHLASLAVTSKKTVRSSALNTTGWGCVYIPLLSAQQGHGILVLAAHEDTIEVTPEKVAFCEAYASLLAIALERLHFVDVAYAHELSVTSERLRSSILSALSHDLRTPLTVLVGLADSLATHEPPLPADAVATSVTIQDQARRLSSLVSNLLEMARLNAGNVQLRLDWHDITDVVSASIEHLGEALKPHPLSVEIAPHVSLVQIDATLMERVVTNLLENAAKYSPKGSPITLQVSETQDELQLVVRDEGPGIDSQKLDTMFDMFERGTKESTIQGFGLGLSICKVIVQAHGGRITAVNRASSGAELWVCLPKGTPPSVPEESV
jgi:two-component system, OmpR family, sensor histidine kinase KdpD